jgi:hypothetical protein
MKGTGGVTTVRKKMDHSAIHTTATYAVMISAKSAVKDWCLMSMNIHSFMSIPHCCFITLKMVLGVVMFANVQALSVGKHIPCIVHYATLICVFHVVQLNNTLSTAMPWLLLKPALCILALVVVGHVISVVGQVDSMKGNIYILSF